MRCIYCLNDESCRTFKTRDHIILRSLGGQTRLDHGIVCDDCNNRFSVLEKRFIYDSLISLPKQFHGPKGRSGVYKSNLQVMIDRTSEEISIGYIEQGGLPKYPPQFKIGKDNFVTYKAAEHDIEKEYDKMNSELKKIDNGNIIIKINDSLLLGEPILTYYKNKIFCFINSEIDLPIIFKLCDAIRKDEFKPDFNLLNRGNSFVNVKNIIAYHFDDTHRVIAKMAFNSMAKYYGSSFVLNDRFNGLREYIYNNVKPTDFEFVHMINKEDTLGIYKGMKQGLRFPDNSHIVLCGNLYSQQNIIAIVSLYDGSFEFGVSNDKTCYDLFSKLNYRILVSDYQKNRNTNYLRI